MAGLLGDGPGSIALTRGSRWDIACAFAESYTLSTDPRPRQIHTGAARTTVHSF